MTGTTVRRLLALLLAIAVSGVWALRLWAQGLVAPPETVVFGLTPAQWVVFLSNVGFGGVFLYFLLTSLKRQQSLEEIVRRYDDTQQAHLQAFRDISEAYRELLGKAQDTMILGVQVQTRLVEKLERMERTREEGGRP